MIRPSAGGSGGGRLYVTDPRTNIVEGNRPSMNKVIRIGIHLAIWGLIVLFCNYLPWQWGFFSSKPYEDTLLVPILYGSVFNALIFYVHSYVLYDHLRTKPWRYFVGVAVLFAVCGGVEGVLDINYALYVVPEKVHEAFGEFTRGAAGAHSSIVWASMYLAAALEASVVHLMFYIFSFAYLLPRANLQNRRRQEALEKEQLRTELKYLRAQINPHFLFNGINSVYHLIDDRPQSAKEVLITFSSLLRYQLYEAGDDSIALAKEVQHLQDYIALEKIRKGDDAVVQSNLPASVGEELHIAPLLLTPFVENAFKYLSNREDADQNILRIELHIDGLDLHFTVANTYDAMLDAQTNDIGGIGLANVRKRLDLLYPDKHTLNITRANKIFTVDLHMVLA